MFGTIDVPEPFYDYEKKDKAAVAARWALKTAMSAAVEAEKKALKQAAVQQAKAEKDAVKAVRAATKRLEENAAAEQPEPAEGKPEKAGEAKHKTKKKRAADKAVAAGPTKEEAPVNA